MSNTFIIYLLAVIVVIGSGVWFWSVDREAGWISVDIDWPRPVSNRDEDTEQTAYYDSEPPDGYQTYQDKNNKFYFFYPKGLTVKDYEEGGGARTIVFQNIDTAEGFQIYIVPYGQSQVTLEQFQKDVPSGVQKDLKTVKIDGATGAAFGSEHALLGETYEVWFIHDGYLYEVTTLKSLETWLNNIIQTWHFI